MLVRAVHSSKASSTQQSSKKERAMLNLTNIRSYVVPDLGADFSKYGYTIGLIMLILAISLIVGRFGKKSINKKYISRIFTWSSIVALIIYLFRYENVVYFTSDLWILFIFIVYFVGIAWSIIKIYRTKPIIQEQEQKLNEFQKYLPKTKKLKTR
jgi:hypothetical protein